MWKHFGYSVFPFQWRLKLFLLFQFRAKFKFSTFLPKIVYSINKTVLFYLSLLTAVKMAYSCCLSLGKSWFSRFPPKKVSSIHQTQLEKVGCRSMSEKVTLNWENICLAFFWREAKFEFSCFCSSRSICAWQCNRNCIRLHYLFGHTVELKQVVCH